MTASLQLTHVTLRVTDLARSRDFYTGQLGFVVSASSADRLELATTADTPPLLSLIKAPEATSDRRNAAGLFHAALLFPSRAALASWLACAAAQHVAFDGFSDHGVSEALYFSDPDGNGLEFYTDRPREQWPYRDGELAMVTNHLDVRALLAEAMPTSTPLAGAHWGHLHLRVTDLARSEAFYRSQLGLEVTQRSYPGARFLAADGYHHHLGLNTWGQPTDAYSEKFPGLAAATFARHDISADISLRDPDGIPLRLTPFASS